MTDEYTLPNLPPLDIVQTRSMRGHPKDNPLLGERHVCCECGAEVRLRWDSRTNEELRDSELCFTCIHWDRYVGRQRDSRSVRVKGVHYWIGPQTTAHPSVRGFGGASWTIRFHDGRVVQTTNLWCQGTISDHYRERLPDNAVFGEAP